MVALSTVVAVAVVCAVVVIVATVIGTVLYVKKRQDRLSLAVVNAGQGYSHHLPSIHTNTLTSLSREEGSYLRQSGQLPYGRPGEWGMLTSHESLISPPEQEPMPGYFAEKRALRRSFSWSRSKKQSQNPVRPHRGSSLAPLTESNKELLCPPGVRGPKEEISVSAVEGVLELPTETTPRHTPERDEEPAAVDTIMRPISADGHMHHKRERSGSLFPVLEDSFEGYDSPQRSRPRGGSITMQTPGAAPEQPAPPPPVAYPPNRFRLSKNDSMRFSTLSLETADSSILEDPYRTSDALESAFASPALPPCPTFMPYSANDVGRIEYDGRTFTSTAPAFPAPFIFPASSPSRNSQQRLDSSRDTSPRRSQTARSPSHSVERISPPPRRSESLSASQSRRDPRSSTHSSPPIHVPPLNVPNRQSSLLRHLSPTQRHSMHSSNSLSQRRDSSHSSNSDPFYTNGIIHARRSNGFLIQEAALNGLPKPPLPSALKKNGSGPRKGHKRQNCVRISIHPPITFGGPTFSPMVEEPEDLEELHHRSSNSHHQNSLVRRSDLSHLTYSSPYNSNSSVSSFSMGRSSYQDLNPHWHPQYNQYYGPPQRPSLGPPSSSDGPRPASHRDSTRKRRHRRTQSADAMSATTHAHAHPPTQRQPTLPVISPSPAGSGTGAGGKPSPANTTIKSLPELLTTVPPSTSITSAACLSSTPSPEKKPPPVWMAPSTFASSPTTYENISPGSPRRSAVKGPRNQPGKPAARNSVRAVPLEETARSSTAANGSPKQHNRASTSTATRGSFHRPTSTITNTNTNTNTSTNQITAPSAPNLSHQQNNFTPFNPNMNKITPLDADQDEDDSPVSPLRSNSRRIVPIWEDVSLARHPTTKSTISIVSQDGPAELQGDDSAPTATVSAMPPPPMPAPTSNGRASVHGQARRSRQFTTPQKKAIGLGIGAITPGSLYDGDGFLKE